MAHQNRSGRFACVLTLLFLHQLRLPFHLLLNNLAINRDSFLRNDPFVQSGVTKWQDLPPSRGPSITSKRSAADPHITLHAEARLLHNPQLASNGRVLV